MTRDIPRLKKDIQETRDYFILEHSIWKSLAKWYPFDYEIALTQESGRINIDVITIQAIEIQQNQKINLFVSPYTRIIELRRLAGIRLNLPFHNCEIGVKNSEGNYSILNKKYI